MRNTYIVCYDISDPKRLRDVFKTMRRWGDHLQLSVFECRLTRAELVVLKAELAEIISEAAGAIDDAWRAVRLEQPPPPLVDSPKCPGCLQNLEHLGLAA